MFKVSLDTKDFDKALEEYTRFSKKAPSEIINSKLFFIARQATFTTKAADKNAIRAELEAPSIVNPNVSLAVVLSQKREMAKNGQGLPANKIASAVKKFIGARTRSVNFLRSGWLPAIRILENAVKRGDITFARRFAPAQNRAVKQYGEDKGRARYARPDVDRTYGEIENDIQGSSNSDKVNQILFNGLQQAVNKEVASMRQYIERKYNEAARKFNK